MSDVDLQVPEQEIMAVTRKITTPGIDADRISQFKKVAKARSADGPFSIIIAQIDPDAIASAFAMQELLGQEGYSSHIYYQGRVGHPQNEALCNKLGLMSRMQPLPNRFGTEDGGSDPETTSIPFNHALPNVVLVDSNRANDSRLPFPVSPVIVVDHHMNSDIKAAKNIFLWLDETSGAASTMMAELLSEITDSDWILKSDLALMLAIGIYTDCDNNTRSSDRDDAAYAWVKRYTNATDLAAIVNYKRPFSFLKNLARATLYVEKYDTYRKGRILGGLGRIPEKQGDDLAMVAIELLRTIGAPLAVTWALIEVKDKATDDVNLKIRVCARSEDYNTNLPDTLSSRFGKKSGAKTLPDGSAEGGALFEFPVGPWLKDDEMEEIVNRRIIEWFYDQDLTSGESE